MQTDQKPRGCTDEERGGRLARPLLPRGQRPAGYGAVCGWVRHLQTSFRDLCGTLQTAFVDTTDVAFIRSEVNGRNSRCIVLLAFFCTDVIGAILWAGWCEAWWGNPGPTVAKTMGQGRGVDFADHNDVCSSFGINHFLLLSVALPTDGAALFLAGMNPWSFWSDALLLPVWLIRLCVFDVFLWNISPQALVSDALWFAVVAVMCRVHSIALAIVVVSQVLSLFVLFRWHGELRFDTFEHVRYGIYSAAVLVITATTYALDEQTRLQSFMKLMSLQDRNTILAETLLRWKVLPERSPRHSIEQEELMSTAGLQLQRQLSLLSDRFPGMLPTCLPLSAWQAAGEEDVSTNSLASGSQSCPLAGQQTAAMHPRSSLRRAGGAGGASCNSGRKELDISFQRRGNGRSSNQGVRSSLPPQANVGQACVPITRPRAGFGHTAQPQDMLDVME